MSGKSLEFWIQKICDEPGRYLAKGTGINDFGSAMQCCVSFSVLLSA